MIEAAGSLLLSQPSTPRVPAPVPTVAAYAPQAACPSCHQNTTRCCPNLSRSQLQWLTCGHQVHHGRPTSCWNAKRVVLIIPWEFFRYQSCDGSPDSWIQTVIFKLILLYMILYVWRYSLQSGRFFSTEMASCHRCRPFLWSPFGRWWGGCLKKSRLVCNSCVTITYVVKPWSFESHDISMVYKCLQLLQLYESHVYNYNYGWVLLIRHQSSRKKTTKSCSNMFNIWLYWATFWGFCNESVGIAAHETWEKSPIGPTHRVLWKTRWRRGPSAFGCPKWLAKSEAK